MGNVKLIVGIAGKEPGEMEIFGEVTTFGRGTDNSVSFAGDSNVSRYHAQIAKKGEEFFVSDYGSSNGTTVNGEGLNGERLLKHGDKVVFGGGESHIVFLCEQEAEQQDEYSPGFSVSSADGSQSAAQPSQSNSKPLMLTGAAVLGGLAVVSVIGVGAFMWSDITGSCTPEVAVLNPESGYTITAPTEVQVRVKNAKCIDRVSYQLDGEEIDTVEIAPYSITLEPDKFEQFKDDDSSHVLTVTVYDKSGNKKIQPNQILLAFADEEKKRKDDEDDPTVNTPTTTPTSTRTAEITIADTKALSEQLLRQFTGNFAYKFDQQFLREVQKKTAEYRAAQGYHNRALQYRDAINQAFIGEQGLDAPLGYVLAMSRSKFDNKRSANTEGLWQMTNDFATSNGYNGQCGTETLSDARQQCAARAAAIYTKALANIFQGDIIYTVSSYGLSPAEAGQFAISLPPDRSDFWNVIRNPKQRDALARFFAAGIVAENPEKFGLKNDKKLSELYKNLITAK